MGISNVSIPVEDPLYYKIVYLSDFDQGEPNILDNRDNNKIRKIIKEKNFLRKCVLMKPDVFNNDAAFNKVLNCKLFHFIKIYKGKRNLGKIMDCVKRFSVHQERNIII